MSIFSPINKVLFIHYGRALLLSLHPYCLLNPYEKRPLSILSTQPYQFLSSNFTPKYLVDMFPCTYFGPLGRVDNFDVNSGIRLNKGLQPCYQYHALHMARVDRIDVCELFFIASVRGNMSMGFSVIFEKSPFAGTYPLCC